MTQFVEADYTGHKITHNSHSGILIYLNISPILWYSRKHNTVDSSTFVLKIVVLRTGSDIIKGLHYKLRIMVVPIDRPTLLI